MGHAAVEPKDKLKPGFDKLGDGAAVRVAINVNRLTSRAKSLRGYNVNGGSSITCYVPKKNRHPEKYTRFDPTSTQSDMPDDDVQYETPTESLNNSMINGMTVGVRAAVAQAGKTGLCTEDGEPIYGISVMPVFKVTKGGQTARPGAKPNGPCASRLPDVRRPPRTNPPPQRRLASITASRMPAAPAAAAAACHGSSACTAGA